MIKTLSAYFEHCEPNWQVPTARTNNHILLVVTEGSMVYTIENQPYHLQKGDILFIPQGTVRSAANISSDIHAMYVAHFEYSGDGEHLPLLTDRQMRCVHSFHFEYLKTRFSLLSQHWLRKSPYTATLCHSILLEILSILNEQSDSSSLPNKHYRLVMQLQHYILEHYREQIQLSELSALVERTPNYVSTIYKQATGQTITEYIQQIRIEAARDLLINSQMTIGEISEALGFCEQSYFNKVFKKITGTLPSAYLKEKVKVWRV
ncbi:hypothetical protein GCM10008018_48610 [Paenibacillus marchantiophytorum]|uniref:HTH araC/xylS-type domain-containing protein n=1 Tax=Paenibacillus marchantiophytorum TaxID=1619310 RepID=A0ABQ1F1K0_9BACL|nr:AraC family transcriptional regulator [Paenibacillus marchantiophytorum]GFZ96504.1 hypothetical protein GCM10008018_48610 [Paenibacillus marchantiophytorum]